jgi:hypothetical protein
LAREGQPVMPRSPVALRVAVRTVGPDDLEMFVEDPGIGGEGVCERDAVVAGAFAATVENFRDSPSGEARHRGDVTAADVAVQSFGRPASLVQGLQLAREGSRRTVFWSPPLLRIPNPATDRSRCVALKSAA